MERVGDILRNTRKEKGISLRQVEEATKIRLRYLEALENNHFDIIPGRVYAIGFFRNYARFLGIETPELLEKFKSEYPPKIEYDHMEEAKKTVMPRAGAGRRRRLILAAGVIVALLGINWMFNYFQPSVDQPPIPPITREPLLEPEPSPNDGQSVEEPVPPQIQGVEVVINASGDCWTSVMVDGEDVFTGMLRNGDSRVFQGEAEVSMRLGSAGMVQLIVNGEVQPSPGRPGDVVDLVFRAKNED